MHDSETAADLKTATLVIRRKRQAAHWLVTYTVFVDKVQRAKLDRGETTSVEVAVGSHVVQTEVQGVTKSLAVEVDVTPGQTIVLETSAPPINLLWLMVPVPTPHVPRLNLFVVDDGTPVRCVPT